MKFTATHVTILGVVLLLVFGGLAGYDMYQKNQPEITPRTEIESALEEIFEEDTVVGKPVVYEYQKIVFDSIQSDTTYWFVEGFALRETGGGKNYFTIAFKMPFQFFNFLYFADKYGFGDRDDLTYSVRNFIQISEASYESYFDYAKKY